MKAFKIRIDEKNPVHTRFTIFAGDAARTVEPAGCTADRMREAPAGIRGMVVQTSTFANCGQLAMRNEEFIAFVDALNDVLVMELEHT